jgi:tetratricopeptide (TPR) repeat protein
MKWNTMFEFGRELRRIFGGTGRLQPDSSLYELMSLEILVGQGRALDIEAGRVSTKNRYDPYIEAAQVWREYARRTGDPLALRKAATAAENAGKESKTMSEAANAALEQAKTCILGNDLFDTSSLLTSAETLIAEARSALDHQPELKFIYCHVEARLAARLAVLKGIGEDLEPALAAMALIDRVVEMSDQRVQQTKAALDKVNSAHARLERADLLMHVGIDRADASIMQAVITDLEAVKIRLDADSEPVTYGRVVHRLGLAHIHLGEIYGDAKVLARGIALMSPEDELIHYEHSPLDWIEHKQALAMGLQAVAELSLDQATYDKAIAIYDMASQKPLQRGLNLRAQLMNNRATCLARQAELKGDLNALEKAEAAFKAELRFVKASDDPVSWAILQTNLGRLYVARGDLTGFMLEGTEAAYALEAAHEIFTEHGLVHLADTALSQLDRVRENGRPS